MDAALRLLRYSLVRSLLRRAVRSRPARHAARKIVGAVGRRRVLRLAWKLVRL